MRNGTLWGSHAALMDAGFPAKMSSSLVCVYQKAPIVWTPTEAAIARRDSANAGGPAPGGCEDVTPAQIEQAFRVTLMSVVHLCRAAVPRKKRRCAPGFPGSPR